MHVWDVWQYTAAVCQRQIEPGDASPLKYSSEVQIGAVPQTGVWQIFARCSRSASSASSSSSKAAMASAPQPGLKQRSCPAAALISEMVESDSEVNK